MSVSFVFRNYIYFFRSPNTGFHPFGGVDARVRDTIPSYRRRNEQDSRQEGYTNASNIQGDISEKTDPHNERDGQPVVYGTNHRSHRLKKPPCGVVSIGKWEPGE